MAVRTARAGSAGMAALAILLWLNNGLRYI